MIRLAVGRKNMQLPDRNGNIKSDYSCKETSNFLHLSSICPKFPAAVEIAVIRPFRPILLNLPLKLIFYFFLVQTGQMRLLLPNVKKHFFKHIYTRLMEIFYSLANISCQSSFFSILVSTIFIAFIQNCNAFKIYSYFYPYAIFVNSVADQSPRQLSSNQNCRTLLQCNKIQINVLSNFKP